LASGSSGNSALVRSDEACVLFDAGLSMKYILSCLNKLDISPREIDGIFLSHEHTDHIGGAGILSRNQKIPLLCNKGTWNAAKRKLGKVYRYKLFETEEPVIIKDLEILPVPVSHDAAEPVCFRICQPRTKLQIGIVTDIGILTPPVKHHLHNLNLLMLEANYDLDMLVQGKYPPNVKLFIMGDLGHLSNTEAGESLVELLGEKTKHVLLSHISKDNNTPELAHDTLSKVLRRHGITDLDLGLTYHNQMAKACLL